MLRWYLFVVICFISTTAFAYQIVTPVPRDYIQDVTPQGYIACGVTKTGVYRNVWSGAHKVCQYNIPGSEMWVAGYWQCHRYQPRSGICSGWKWVLAHWDKKENVQLEPDKTTRSGWHT